MKGVHSQMRLLHWQGLQKIGVRTQVYTVISGWRRGTTRTDLGSVNTKRACVWPQFRAPYRQWASSGYPWAARVCFFAGGFVHCTGPLQWDHACHRATAIMTQQFLSVRRLSHMNHAVVCFFRAWQLCPWPPCLQHCSCHCLKCCVASEIFGCYALVRGSVQIRKIRCLKDRLAFANRKHILRQVQTKICFARTNTMSDPAFLISFSRRALHRIKAWPTRFYICFII